MPQNLPKSPLESCRPPLLASEEPTIGTVGKPTGSDHPTIMMEASQSQAFKDDHGIDGNTTSHRGPLYSHFDLFHIIARGGQGEVWESFQPSLKRTVAVKKMIDMGMDLDGFSKEDSRRIRELNFRREALTAASLEHPNIVPVHELGVDNFGNPLIAMKLVEGESWGYVIHREYMTIPMDDYLARHLHILLNVAQAVSFAHSKGIIHRDLKPDQVMIGRFGEALLMDWGLAVPFRPRLIGNGVELLPMEVDGVFLRAVNPAGTPAYMAPEQTWETTDSLGPWTDIYLLGGILYFLLTGFPPHSGETGMDAFNCASVMEVVPPQARRPTVNIPKVLSKVALKALSRDIKQRHASVDAFINDLREYLSGADRRRESLALSKIVLKEMATGPKDYATLGSALDKLHRSLMLWPGNKSAEMMIPQIREQYVRSALQGGDLKLAKLHADALAPGLRRTAFLEEIEALEREEKSMESRLRTAYRDARSERDHAVRSRSSAETLLGYILGDLHSSLKSIGRLDILLEATTKAHEYFDALSDMKGTDASVENRAVGYRNIADVLRDQAHDYQADIAYTRALNLYSELLLENPFKPEWISAMADVRERLGSLKFKMGDSTAAELELAESLSLLRSLSPSDSQQPSNRLISARALLTSGRIYWRIQNLAQADKQFHAAWDLMKSQLSLDPTNPKYLALKASVLEAISNLERDRGNFQVAIERIRDAIRFRQSVVQLDARNVLAREQLLHAKGTLGYLMITRGEHHEAQSIFEELADSYRRLLRDEPNHPVWLESLCHALSLLADIQFAACRINPPLILLKEALLMANRCLGCASSPEAMANLAHLRLQIAEVFYCKDDGKNFSDHVDQGLPIAIEAQRLSPDSTYFNRVVTRGLTLMSLKQQIAGDAIEAAELREAAVAKEKELTAANPVADFVYSRGTQLTLALLAGDAELSLTMYAQGVAENWVTPLHRRMAQMAKIKVSHLERPQDLH